MSRSFRPSTGSRTAPTRATARARLCAAIALFVLTADAAARAGGLSSRRGGGAPLPEDAPAAWGADVNPGAGRKLIDAADGELVAFLRLAPNARARRAAELSRQRATGAIEAWKRFRNPELAALAVACLDHADWHVVHRALHWLSAIDARAALRPALERLDHAQPLLRERAILAAIDGWDDATAAAALGGPPLPRLSARRERERDPHLQAALTALIERIEGTRLPRRLADEPLQTRADGLIWTPFLAGESEIPTVALDRPRTPTWATDTASATPPATTAVGWPLLQFDREEVPRITLQPFGKPRREGALYHTGIDVGACRDGSGYYAPADGIVRLVDSGGTAGTRFVVHFVLPAAARTAATASDDDVRINAIWMHASARVFVAAGERVVRHQLLGTMGDSYSFENGGHFAHLHFGIYPGPFRSNHNHGYQPAAMGLDDWLDPAVVLPRWIGGAPPK